MDINLIILIFFIVSVILILRFTGINESVDHSEVNHLAHNDLWSDRKVTIVVMHKWVQKARVTREYRPADDELLQELELGRLDDSKTKVIIHVNELHNRYETWAEAYDAVTGKLLASTKKKIDPLTPYDVEFADDDSAFRSRKKVREVTVTKNSRVVWSGEITERELDDEESRT